MKKLVIVMLTASSWMLGQTPAPAAPKPVAQARVGDLVKVLDVTGDPGLPYNSRYLGALRGLYPEGSGVTLSLDGVSKTIVVRGPASAMKIVEDEYKRIRASLQNSGAITGPPPNVEVTVQLLYAATKAEANATVPQDLAATVQRLRTTFPFASYRLMDTMLLRGRDAVEMSESGTLAGGTNVYSLRYTPHVGPKGAQRTVGLTRLVFSASMKTTSGINSQIGIQVDVDSQEGQKMVLGKSNISGTDDAIFLVVSTKVIE